MSLSSFADRSRVLAFQGCPRRRYFEYELPNPGNISGVVPTRLDMNLLVGSCFHKGVEYLLEKSRIGFSIHPPEDSLIDNAVDYALDEFWPVVKARGLILDPEEDASYVAYEQAALVEALIRGYAIFVLPQVLERFQVVEVEQEEMGRFEIPGFTLSFGARLDGLLLEKDTLNLYVLSLKTTKEWGRRDDQTARHDMQGLSETRVVEQKLARWQNQLDALKIQFPEVWETESKRMIPDWFIERYKVGAPPTVTAVLMQFALKGRREQSPRGSGRYTFNNPLIRPWKKADDLGGPSYAFRYEFQDPMGGNHRLGKGWNRVNIWEDMGVKKWIEVLATRELQGFAPMTALEAQFVLPVEYFRSEEDMDRWERQVVAQENRIVEGCQRLIPSLTPAEMEFRLDEEFPMHTRSCDWPTTCSFQEVCFGPKAYLHDPLASGLYQIRAVNHPTEKMSLTNSGV